MSELRELRVWLMGIAILALALRCAQGAAELWANSFKFPVNHHPHVVSVLYDGTFMRRIMP